MPSSTSSFSGDEDGDVRAAAAAAVPKESKESKKRARSESSDSEERRKRKKKEKHKKEKGGSISIRRKRNTRSTSAGIIRTDGWRCVDAVCRVSDAAWRGCHGLKCESASVRKLIDFCTLWKNYVSAPHKASCLFRLCSDRNPRTRCRAQRRRLLRPLDGLLLSKAPGSHVGGLLFCSPLRAPFLH